jgi:hypothetical protein
MKEKNVNNTNVKLFRETKKMFINKRAVMALDRSPDPSNSSEQLPRQAF